MRTGEPVAFESAAVGVRTGTGPRGWGGSLGEQRFLLRLELVLGQETRTSDLSESFQLLDVIE